MARISDIRLRRSAVSGNIPTTEQLNLGELALNTADGKVYMKREIGGVQSIVEIGSGGGGTQQSAVWKQYNYTATAGQTVFTGSDDNSQSLSYIIGFVKVFLNGILLDPATDYDAFTGESVTLTVAAAEDDLIQIDTFVKVLGTGDTVIETFTGDGLTDTYTLDANPGVKENILVFIDGVYQETDSFTYNSSTQVITLSENLPDGSSMEVAIGSRNLSVTDVDNFSITGQLTANQILVQDAPGAMSWNSHESTLDIPLNSEVTLQTGQEFVKYVYNDTGSTIPNGSSVGFAGASDGDVLIEPYIADGTMNPNRFMGITTQDIADGEYGFVTTLGNVRDIDTSAFSIGDFVYASATTASGITNVAPESPNYKIMIGIVSTVSATEGKILLRPDIIPISADITYDNTTSGLVSTNVKGAIDELQNTKADISLLSSNIVLFPTTASSPDVANHSRLISDKSDSDYDDPAVDVPTGVIGTTETMVGQLASDAGLINGSVAGITVTLIGNIEKTAGIFLVGASFYFKIFRRESDGTEHLMGTSGETETIFSTDGYQQFSASVYLANSGNSTFAETDRIVIRFYGVATGGGTEYQFQFGGEEPIRAIIPVQASVLPVAAASAIPVVTTSFDGLLSGSDSNVQAALNTIDDIDLSVKANLSGATFTGKITAPELHVDSTGAIEMPTGTEAQRPTAVAGMLRFNTEVSQFEGYDGTNWGTIAGGGGGAAPLITDLFTVANNGDTAFTLSNRPTDEDSMIVFIEGIYQNKNSYVLSGDTITFSEGLTAGQEVVVHQTGSLFSGSTTLVDEFTADGLTNSFTLTNRPLNKNNIKVFFDGVYQHKSEYSVSGTTLTFNETPEQNTDIEVLLPSFTELDEPADLTVTAAKLAEELNPVFKESSTFSTFSAVNIATVDKTVYRSVKYQVQITDTVSDEFHITEINCVHNGSVAYITEYGTIFTDEALGTFDVTFAGDNLVLQFTPANSNSMESKVVYTPVEV